MDFGPCLMTTFDGGGLCGTTEKGLVIRLGDRGAVSFDTELLRMSVAWTDGWLRLRGTAYDGSHGPFPSRLGRKLAETAVGPGWSRNGSFADPRAIPHGPLPNAWGKYGGHSRVGEDVVIDYRLADMAVREMYALEDGPVPVLLRTLELGPSKAPQQMVVLDGPDGASDGQQARADSRAALLTWQLNGNSLIELDASMGDWQALAFGGPSNADYLDANSGSGATIQFVDGFAKVHNAQSPLLSKLMNGLGAVNQDDTTNSIWFDRAKVDGQQTDHGRFVVDLVKAVDVSRINTFSWHFRDRARQGYVLYGRNGAGDPAAKDLAAAGWQRIADVDTNDLGNGGQHAVSIAKPGGLGTFTHLLFDVTRGGTFFSEVDVYAGDHKSPLDAEGASDRHLAVAVHGSDGATVAVDGRRVIMNVPAHDQAMRVQLAITAFGGQMLSAVMPKLTKEHAISGIPHGPGKQRWAEKIVTKGVLGADDGAFAVDTITIPFENPWGSRMRTGAFDFFSDGRAAVSTWNGDVWIVSGIDADLDNLEWQRFATGLFDPLGLRIVDDVVHVHGRDGLTRLIDTNNDGEADRYECFNNQVYITAAFHEFAFDLQTDSEGNFYFTKGAPVNPGGRGFMKIVPHHGTILKVSKDGSTIETIASGMRAPNGIGVSPDGIITSGDNEGTYMPRCRLNWIEKPGYYAGVKDTAHRTPVPDQPDLPLCWMPMDVDNSSGGQVWVTGSGWPDLQGRLLHNSYGTCSTYLVLPERVDGQMQGGLVRLPANYSSSCMRGRFSPIDGQMYVIGLKGWQTSAAREGGFHRVRRTDRPLDLPIALSTCDKGVYLTFSDQLDAEMAADPESFGVQIWNYRYSQNYGSPEVSILHPERQIAQGKPNRDPLKVTSSKLSDDGRTVFLAIEGMQPVNQMKITWDLDSRDGRAMRGELHNTIHALQQDPGFPKAK
jgi:hypothetical protein